VQAVKVKGELHYHLLRICVFAKIQSPVREGAREGYDGRADMLRLADSGVAGKNGLRLATAGKSADFTNLP